MELIKKLMNFFNKKRPASAPILIIKKDMDDSEIKEYKTIEAAITDLENDKNISKEKIAKLRQSIDSLKKRTSIKIRNGEII